MACASFHSWRDTGLAWFAMAVFMALGMPGAIAQTADLGISLRSMTSLPRVGAPLILQITVTNHGPADATSVTVSNPLPATVTYLNSSSSQGTTMLTENGVLADLGTLGLHSNATVTVHLRPGFSGALELSASAFAAGADLNLADNTSNIIVTILSPFLSIQTVKGSLPEGDTGSTNAQFIVSLPASGDIVSVTYSTTTGERNTATEGIDFIPVSGTLVFPPGVTSNIISVEVLGDILDEHDEFFSVQLSNPTNAVLAQGGFARATIADDDPIPAVSISDASLLEGDAGLSVASFQVTLSAPSGRTASVRCATLDGTAIAGADYLATNLFLVFQPGNVTQSARVLVKGNTVYEGDETFVLRLNTPSNLILGTADGAGLILDDDLVPGRLDHFVWSPIPSPQLAGIGFSATVTALDAFSNVVLDFQGSIPLIALGAPEDPSLSVTPATLSNFVAGVWQGTLAVTQPNAAVVLRADDGQEHRGESNPFIVAPPPVLALHLPSEATEGDGVLDGMVSVATDLPRAEDLLIHVAVSDEIQASAIALILIPAGSTNAPLNLAIEDDAWLDGSQPVTVTVSASNTIAASATVLVHDNESTTLTLDLPSSVMENAGTVAGVLRAAQPPALDVAVNLTVDDSAKVQAPSVLVLPAGATEVPFNLLILDNHDIDGIHETSLGATVRNWNAGMTLLTVLDDEPTNLVLTLPVSLVEGQGVLQGGGRVDIGGILDRALTIFLTSSDPGKISVPPLILMPAGVTSMVFTVVALEDSHRDGTRIVQITARAEGLGDGIGSIQVVDNDPYRITIDPIPSPQTSGVPFEVRVRVYDTNGLPAVGYTGGAALLAWASTLVPVSPTVTGPFVNGEWNGLVAVTNIEEEVRLAAYVLNDVGELSNPFLLKAPQVQVLHIARIRDLVYSPHAGRAYVSIKGNFAFISSISWLNPETGALQHWKTPYYYPDRLALSRDGQMLYVMFPWDGGYGRFPTAGGFDLLCSFGNNVVPPVNVPWQTEDFEVLGQPDLLAATRYFFYDGGFWTASAHHGIAVYPAGYPLADAFSPGVFGMRLTTSDDGQTIYCTWPGGYAQLTVTSNGVSPVKVLGEHPVAAFANGFEGDLAYDRGLLYRENGDIVDPNRIELVGRLPSGGLVRPDSAINRVFLLARDDPANTWHLHAFDQATYVPLGKTNLAQISGTPSSLIRCGSNTLAFVTSGEQLFLVHGLLLPHEPDTDLATFLEVATPAITLSNSTSFTLVVLNQGANTANDVVLSARLPAALGSITLTSAEGSCSASDGTVTCALPRLEPGTISVLQFEVPTLVAGAFPCIASVASRAREMDYSNNVSQVTLLVSPSSDSPLQISRIRKTDDGIALQFPTLGGDRYRVERSPNLNPDSWTPVMDYIYGTGQTMEFAAPSTINPSAGFYRLVRMP